MFRISLYRFGLLHKNLNARLVINCCDFSSDSGQQNDDSGKKQAQPEQTDQKKSSEKSTAALKRLNELLTMMNTDNQGELAQLVKKVNIAQPPKQEREKAKKKQQAKDSGSDSDSDDEKPKDLLQATRNVASSLGGDANKTEAELLKKLLGGSDSKEAVPAGNLKNVITGMQVEKEGGDRTKGIQLTRSKLVRKSIESKGRRDQAEPQKFYEKKERNRLTVLQPTGASVKLFEEEPLNIFTDPSVARESPDILKTWKKLQDRELRLAVTHPPANYFQKMALWTEQGKLWKFPIDNEQGLEREADVSFTEHIFLEEHLEPWCPKRGPIRHFMELVCVGLSRNYHITAQEKKEHILWFRDYFEQKKDILKHAIVQQPVVSSDKQVEL
ncbi:28S ribosomal protein S31, mitochondrial [Toxorhynchites rutilus septentrionalis]|uniref:28S ribosomal protein S31, mitochondrial n=1 Tax=Toxorhynchites rutilus septentrionalis TaxID=329112 RepID=UPI0024785EC2|nr:28S ribosomal protein S31, mitochondrial [Toxorhynchites rutilus septentrionalis]